MAFVIERAPGMSSLELGKRYESNYNGWQKKAFRGVKQPAEFSDIVEEAAEHGLVPYTKMDQAPQALLLIHVWENSKWVKQLAGYVNQQVRNGNISYLLAETLKGKMNYEPSPVLSAPSTAEPDDRVARVTTADGQDCFWTIPKKLVYPHIFATARECGVPWVFDDDRRLYEEWERTFQQYNATPKEQRAGLLARLHELLDARGKCMVAGVQDAVQKCPGVVAQFYNIRDHINGTLPNALEESGIPFVVLGPKK